MRSVHPRCNTTCPLKDPTFGCIYAHRVHAGVCKARFVPLFGIEDGKTQLNVLDLQGSVQNRKIRSVDKIRYRTG